MPGLVFFSPQLVTPGFKAVKTLLCAAHLATINPQCGPRQSRQEGAIVGDQHIAGPCGAQLLFEPGNCFDIEVVGRLIEQHQFGRFGHQLGKGSASPLSPRGSGRVTGGIKFQPFRRHLHAVGLRGLERADRVVAQGCISAEVGVLLHVASGDARWQHARAAVRLHQPGNHFHQRGFARSVAPHQRDPVLLMHDERQVIENRITAEGQRDVGKL